MHTVGLLFLTLLNSVELTENNGFRSPFSSYCTPLESTTRRGCIKTNGNHIQTERMTNFVTNYYTQRLEIPLYCPVGVEKWRLHNAHVDYQRTRLQKVGSINLKKFKLYNFFPLRRYSCILMLY